MAVSPDKIADLQVKQLEIVQGIISRLANYGATLKNYCITLVTAVSGASITLQRPGIALLALLPLVVFLLLDAQFLRIERRYRELFNILRQEEWGTPPKFEIGLRSTPAVSYWSAFFSWSIAAFYLPLAVAVVTAVFVTRHMHGRLF